MMEFNDIMQINLTDLDLDVYENLKIVEDVKGFIRQQQLYNAAIKEIRTKLEILDEEFQVQYDHNPIHHIEYRLKSPKSILQKLKKKDLDISMSSVRENLMDVAGVRVICNYIDDINSIANLLIGQDDITLIEKRDYITHPKENGYRSLHLIVAVPIFLAEKTEKIPVEIQIRTIAMDFWASLEHQLKYKSREDISEELRQRLKNCADSITQLDMEMYEIHQEIAVGKDRQTSL
ncbi:GTP pyrophosphokinase family protein [Irregularibacter muris]|uniref:GTP pyrophosphokinase family protein n=1 Tax=Irregularibacter muris TaxID=1796619 RepID=A0AAE3KYR4_9FIRM|nr:GTP pyrophosphokinase family protein [Irregularibacter muris]MCR1897421.1 GTP pyrophosphokinase family protein [Irregularibacter muris]